MTKYLSLFLVSAVALASSISVGAGASTPTRQLLSVQNYYISTTGNDTNDCGSSSKCRTLAHALSLLPLVLDRNYAITADHGTYAECIDTTGFRGTGLLGGTYAVSITILGDLSSPGSVIFNTVCPCINYFGTGTANAGACISGSAKVLLRGLTITNADEFGIACWGGVMDLNKVVVTLTGGQLMPSGSFGIDNLECHWNHSGDVTVSGFDTATSPTGGLGVYNAHGTVGTCTGGTLTITGPAAGADYHGTVGFVVEYAPSGFTLLDPSCGFSVSGVQTGILVNDNGAFTSYVASTISISNSGTPTGSIGINTSGGGAVNLNSPTLTLNHWTTCYLAAALSVIDHGNGTRTSTNCGTVSNAIQGSQIILF